MRSRSPERMTQTVKELSIAANISMLLLQPSKFTWLILLKVAHQLLGLQRLPPEQCLYTAAAHQDPFVVYAEVGADLVEDDEGLLDFLAGTVSNISGEEVQHSIAGKLIGLTTGLLVVLCLLGQWFTNVNTSSQCSSGICQDSKGVLARCTLRGKCGVRQSPRFGLLHFLDAYFAQIMLFRWQADGVEFASCARA
eukprot:6457601-Amphidinium_carterae.1